jgi:cysteinyl-tRNA synthetase
MSAKYLGDSFDIHCGGVDNIFPHHENEIAQSEAYSGKKFVKTWLHCHHLIVDGEKMSKSKGNYYTVQDLLDRNFDPLAIRLLLLSTHYRKQLNFTLEALKQAQSALNRLNEFVDQLTSVEYPPGTNPEIEPLTKDMIKKFKAGLSDDLNISAASTALFEMVKKTNILLAEKRIKKEDVSLLLKSVASVNKVLAIVKFPDHFQVASELTPGDHVEMIIRKRILPAEIEAKIQERENARQDKNYALADRIRDELKTQGILLEDTKDGVRWKRER